MLNILKSFAVIKLTSANDYFEVHTIFYECTHEVKGHEFVAVHCNFLIFNFSYDLLRQRQAVFVKVNLDMMYVHTVIDSDVDLI